MVLQRLKTIEYEGLGAVSALPMAMFEQTGLREIIDSRFYIDSMNFLLYSGNMN